MLSGETTSHYRKVFKPGLSNGSKAGMPPRNHSAYQNENGLGSYNEITPKRATGYGQSQVPTGTSSSINTSQYSVQHKKPFQSSQTKLKMRRQDSQQESHDGISNQYSYNKQPSYSQDQYLQMNTPDSFGGRYSATSNSKLPSPAPTMLAKKSKLDNLNKKLGKKPPAPQMQQQFTSEHDQAPIRPMDGRGLGPKNPAFARSSPPEQPAMFSGGGPSNLQQCHQCGRSFNDEAYQKHVRICKKVFGEKRKQFNSQAHRIVEAEQKQHIRQNKM